MRYGTTRVLYVCGVRVAIWGSKRPFADSRNVLEKGWNAITSSKFLGLRFCVHFRLPFRLPFRSRFQRPSSRSLAYSCTGTMRHGPRSEPLAPANFRQLARLVIAFRQFTSSTRWSANMDRSRSLESTCQFHHTSTNTLGETRGRCPRSSLTRFTCGCP